MCYKAYRHAEKQVLSLACALVLRTIAQSVNTKNGICWLGQPRIAANSNGLSLSTIKRALKDLIALELVIVTKINHQGRCHNSYSVNLETSVYWDGSATWRQFVKQACQRKQSEERQDGESKADFMKRKLAGLNPALRGGEEKKLCA
jgi:hypothetical protein